MNLKYYRLTVELENDSFLQAIVNNTSGSAPFIVFGPPGKKISRYGARKTRQSKFKDLLLIIEGEGRCGKLVPSKQHPNTQDLEKLQ